MANAFYTDALLPQLKELLANGQTPNQLAAALHISLKQLMEWVNDPDPKYDNLRHEMEVGLTAGQAFWQKEAQLAILGHRKFFKETTFRLYMENVYNWSSSKTDDAEIKSEEQLVPDSVLEEQLKNLLAKTNGRQTTT